MCFCQYALTKFLHKLKCRAPSRCAAKIYILLSWTICKCYGDCLNLCIIFQKNYTCRISCCRISIRSSCCIRNTANPSIIKVKSCTFLIICCCIPFIFDVNLLAIDNKFQNINYISRKEFLTIVNTDCCEYKACSILSCCLSEIKRYSVCTFPCYNSAIWCNFCISASCGLLVHLLCIHESIRLSKL